MAWRYPAVVALVIGLNLLPAFAPPTWAVLVFLFLRWHLNPIALVALGAGAAAAGRLGLAAATRAVGSRRLGPQSRENLTAVATFFTAHRGRAVLGLALFAVSPLPSNQLFEAAGLLEVALLPITAAFFAGRLVSYSGYVGAATFASVSFGDVLVRTLRSPVAIVVQVGLLLLLALLPRVPWAQVLGRRGRLDQSES
jgi:hypothetical protein